ncbi:Phyllosphere-induced regulator PhyR [Hyphomonas sp. CACIAM 19H1]|uniref:response regulator n=1 Tax=Hyphomonas sp. CACIAM 19H1 TaxID=1873716 RepID=UPI000DED94EC|nr:response regulator [Hyphomonas sp. CACIAM 19H1]AXE64530.1 Phyllosphere-induced regulator PhyR [Hyphomonas sp. CACIAM 19H1]
MSLIAQYGPHLPFLRRYARALTGSQESGDAYIRACLEALSEDPGMMEEASSPRVTLYRFFHAIWSTTGARLETVGKAGGSTPEARLRKLAPIQRQAFLLTTLEGFSRPEACEILNKSSDELDQLIDAAHQEIEQQLSTSVLIIEDEPIIAADLANLVEDLGHTFAGNAATRKQAVDLARRVKPGLILCDVQLADNSSGIDAVQDILTDFDLPVIFITAFPERLLTGERPEPTYLITKPFQDDTVKAAISQALFFHAQPEPQN